MAQEQIQQKSYSNSNGVELDMNGSAAKPYSGQYISVQIVYCES